MGNTDLLDKAKIEKQIAGLESEKQAFNPVVFVAGHSADSLTNAVFIILTQVTPTGQR